MRHSFEPSAERASWLQGRLSEQVWERRVEEANQRGKILRAVVLKREVTGDSWSSCLRQVAPNVSWSQYRSWRRRFQANTGSDWERLLDYRTPPVPVVISEKIRTMTEALRLVDSQLDCEAARKILTQKFGQEGAICNTSLRLIWSEAGLAQPKGQSAYRSESVESLHGGGGLALIAAAAEATGVPLAMAEAVLKAGRACAESNDSGPSPLSAPEERDAWGRFTPDYNQKIQADKRPGEDDPRLASDLTKRTQRDLTTLSTLGQKPETLAQKLLCMGATPLLTERRGFSGLAGPQGEWLAALGGTPYMPSTLNKELTQLALLGADSTLWAIHGQSWARLSQVWSQHPQDGYPTAVATNASICRCHSGPILDKALRSERQGLPIGKSDARFVPNSGDGRSRRAATDGDLARCGIA